MRRTYTRLGGIRENKESEIGNERCERLRKRDGKPKDEGRGEGGKVGEKGETNRQGKRRGTIALLKLKVQYSYIVLKSRM
jgi:hypothetical protein